MNERDCMKQICLRIMNKNNKILFVGIMNATAKLITGLSNHGLRTPIMLSKIRKYPSWYEIFAFLHNCDLKKTWHKREVIYVTLESSGSVLAILPLTIDKEKFVVFLINNKENNDIAPTIAPTIEEILYEI